MGAKTQRKEDAETLLLKSEEPPPPKASLRQLFRYASGTDKLLLGLGVLVAIGTGFGWPLMAVVTGNISRNFINVGRRLALNNSAEELEVVLQDFNAAALQSCYDYIYLGCGVFTVGTLQVVCFLTVCENMVHTLRRQFFHAVLRQDIAWFDKNSSGSLTPKLFDNIERVKEGTGDKLGLLLQYVSQFFGGFAIAFFYDWKLTLIMMALTPFMILSGAVIAKIMSSAATRETKKYAIAGGIAEEVLSSMRTVIAFNGQERECSRYNSALEDGKKVGIKKAIFQGAGMAMLFFIMFSSYALAFWVGTNFVYDGTMDGGTVMTVFFAVMLGSMALGQAGPQLAVLGTAMGAAATLYQIIDRRPDIDGYSKEGVQPEELQGKLVLDNVQFAYPSRSDQHVLKGISFEANPGETVALVGSSGCGKSTVIQLLLRYYNALSGTLCIDGININKFNIEQLRKYIGVVSQEPMLFNTTIEQNIRYGNSDITENDILAALRRANAYDFVKNLPDGLKTLVGDHGTQMSGGQKQRIAIARALVRDPKILLLDEATSALDAESEHIVQKALENASKGRTTIVIAHRLSTIRNADKIVAIKDGEVIEIGSHDDLLKKNGLYHDLVNSQVFADVDSNEQNIYDRMESTLSARSQVSSVIDGREMKSRTDTSRLSISEKSKKKPQNDLERLKKEVEEEGVAKASLWRILRYAHSEWALLFGAVLAACFMGCVTPVFSLLFTQIIDVFSNPDRDQMKKDGHWVSLLFLGLGIVQGVFMMTQAFLFGLSSERITYRLRSKIFRNIMRMDAAYFDMPKHSPGKIATRLATDAPNVKSAIDYRLGTVFSAAVSVFFGLGLALYFGWQMALLVMAIFPLAGIGRSIQIKYVSGQATGDARAMENSGKVAMEAIENIRTVQALTLEKLLFEQFCEHLDGPHRNSRKKAIMQAFSYGFATSIVFFLYGASFRFGIWLISAGYLSPIRVLRVLFAISFSAGSLGTASAYFPEYIKATFAAGLIFRMLEEEPGIDNTSKAGAKPKIEGHLHLNNVYFKYPQRPLVPILQGVDIQVRPGKTLALVGSSGCGKSTVVSLLERLYDTLDGQVLIDGHDIRELNPIYFRSFIALVSQEPLLFDTSIRENIVYGLTEGTYTEDDIVRAATEANVHTFITELSKGYDTEVGEKGTQLSGGQKQRIAIARALIRNPKILLLDEATSALDTESEKLVQRALDKASEGRTCIIVAHRLSTVINADCIMVMSDGKVVEQGSHSELMSLKGAYWRLNQRQNVSS